MIDLYEAGGMTTTTRVFVALRHGTPTPLGVLSVDERADVVELVRVESRSRREGIATMLLDAAREATGLALRTTSAELSEAGEQWARARGLTPEGERRRLTEREAEAMGARLMVALYSATSWTPLNDAARETYERTMEGVSA